MLALGIKLPVILPEMLKSAVESKPGVPILPPATLLVTLRSDTTFELRLSPTAFKLPDTTLPVALRIPVLTLLPKILPDAEINPVTYCPVPDTTTMFDVPLIDVDTLPLA